jgi:hypothetical protein
MIPAEGGTMKHILPNTPEHTLFMRFHHLGDFLHHDRMAQVYRLLAENPTQENMVAVGELASSLERLRAVFDQLPGTSQPEIRKTA